MNKMLALSVAMILPGVFSGVSAQGTPAAENPSPTPTVSGSSNAGQAAPSPNAQMTPSGSPAPKDQANDDRPRVGGKLKSQAQRFRPKGDFPMSSPGASASPSGSVAPGDVDQSVVRERPKLDPNWRKRLQERRAQQQASGAQMSPSQSPNPATAASPNEKAGSPTPAPSPR